jgi:hypothetical protein
MLRASISASTGVLDHGDPGGCTGSKSRRRTEQLLAQPLRFSGCDPKETWKGGAVSITSPLHPAGADMRRTCAEVAFGPGADHRAGWEFVCASADNRRPCGVTGTASQL